MDLTMRVSPSLAPFPGSPAVHVMPWATHAADGYALEVVAMSTHTGTHVDAPSHFDPRGACVDEIPPAALVGPARILRARKRRGENVTAAELESLEARGGRLARGSRVIVETRWSERVGPRYYERSPGLEPGAARLLARRRVALVGIDSPSVDPGASRSFPAHRALARAGAVAVENLCNLRAVRGEATDVAILPILLAGASGAPARALAL